MNRAVVFFTNYAHHLVEGTFRRSCSYKRCLLLDRAERCGEWWFLDRTLNNFFCRAARLYFLCWAFRHYSFLDCFLSRRITYDINELCSKLIKLAAFLLRAEMCETLQVFRVSFLTLSPTYQTGYCCNNRIWNVQAQVLVVMLAILILYYYCGWRWEEADSLMIMGWLDC